ncbi:hypothetical protein D1007_08282 [Hordeum vulgare]|uniref:DUF4220 domain-containing protein n=1 Tax=Hordeum vulgare subsp. vulgare TaxID=112509 RepID=A0A8I6YI80_HORVV|nr:uncharacterized protein LOC123410919 [Hordeum vulgare subsp. vulgare]XP_044959780.1 uncharacterized protein LOC123410919 [Hordeum vulgare subsp. vulgare]KAE8814232.1 hypothetical protein D1007_08282 [Hordeum vulgare]
MASLLQLFNEWEIQLLVLLSFVLQIFLFFTGGLRQRGAKFLSGIIWIAYLVADLVAVYALGLLSKLEENTHASQKGALPENHPLAFFWAPFLLLHLGGQDTITAFSLEDNSLWLRHLLNLVVQVALALYVFWKSTAWRNVHQLLVPGIFMFVAGIIKYGERTMALMYGNLQNISGYSTSDESKLNHRELDQDASYSSIVSFCLDSAPIVRHLFAGFTLLQIPQGFGAKTWTSYAQSDEVQLAKLAKLVDVELGIMYCDVYTKAAVLRTRSGILLRCTSQVSALVALVLFVVGNKQRYSRADVAITYTLFIGSFFLEVCAMLMMVMVSPWTWAWMKANKCVWLTRMSWMLVSSNIIGWPEEKPLWSNRMGQYNFLSYVGCEEKPSSSPWSERVTSMIRKMAKAVGKLFWLSKLLDIKYEEVDMDITESFAKEIRAILQSPFGGGQKQEWEHLSRFLHSMARELSDNFSAVIIRLHIATMIHLTEVSNVDAESVALVGICRKLSNYMMYLLVTQPVMLQVTATSAESVIQGFHNKFVTMMTATCNNGGKHVVLQILKEFLSKEDYTLSLPEPCKETLEEMRDMWVRIIMYAAGRSRPETHATQLARGGEFLTFIWLLMAHKSLGASVAFPIDLISPPPTFGPLMDVRYYAFDFRS